MARLHIYVNEKDGKTVSKFGKPKDSDKIVFHNQHASDTLTVTIQGEPQAGSALCKGSQAVDTFTVTPAEQKKAFKICQAYQADTFKYTAQIDGFVLEDPIIIIEKSSFFGGSISMTGVIVTAGIAAALGAYIGFRLAKSRTLPRN